MTREEKALTMIKSVDGLYSPEVAEMIIDALEFRIPKKPNKTIDRTWGISKEVNVCPTCDYYLSNIDFVVVSDNVNIRKVAYCEHCGQAIDYSGENG